MGHRFDDLEIMRRGLFEVRVGIWIVEVDEGQEPRMYVDRIMRELLGIEEGVSPEACYRAWYDGIDDAYYEMVDKAIRDTLVYGRSEVQYLWHHPILGEIFIRCIGVHDTAYTKGFCARGYHQDITSIVRLDQEKKELEELHERMMGSLQDLFFAVYHLDFETEMIKALSNLRGSKHAKEETSYAAFLQKIVEEYIHPSQREKVLSDVCMDKLRAFAREDGRVFFKEFQVKLGDEYRWIAANLYFRRDDSERRDAVIACQDIHEQKIKERESRSAIENAFDEMQKANHAKRDFLSKMSHDIRTPMNGIIGMVNLAKNNLDHRERVERYLNKIDVSSQYLLEIINEILDMSKIESGTYELNTAPFSLSELLHNVTEVMKPLIREKNQKLTFSVENLEHELVNSDSVRMQHVFMNILSNANKYTPAGGHLEWIVREEPFSKQNYGQYQFIFKDNGIGMSKEFLEHIFEPFSREEDSRISKVLGTGLGMAITKNIVHLMDGMIEIESEVGKGSTFTVTLNLPYHTTEESERQQKEYVKMEDLNFTGKHILLVEDNLINQEIAMELLQVSGANVETAENGMEAVEKFRQAVDGYYAAILMDIQMPVMDGNEAAVLIRGMERKDAKEVPIIAMTANAFAEDIALSFRSGMNEHLTKPVNSDEVAEILQKWVT